MDGAVQMVWRSTVTKRQTLGYFGETVAERDPSLTGSNSALIRHIHVLLKNIGPWTIQHTPRDFNKIVDYLAKMAFIQALS
ncbi:hypothetical protein J1N35_012669 [Gossypium stocksii]|uniref:RNase H type-1 domain-containing protein n=1 Tax=Gossypium stocksii TaxID=47602 RepID=A0A9D4AEN1_9ROSI|nr:hypothetical protein J1N35_012669 [Gossypium stocksii]